MLECEPNFLEFHDISIRGETLFRFSAPPSALVTLVLRTESGECHQFRMIWDTVGEYRLALYLEQGRYFTLFEVNGEHCLAQSGELAVLAEHGRIWNVLTIKSPSLKLTIRDASSTGRAIYLVSDSPFVSTRPADIVLRPGCFTEVIVVIDPDVVPEGISFTVLRIKDVSSGRDLVTVPIYCQAGYVSPHVSIRNVHKRPDNEECIEIRKYGPGPLTCYVLDRTTCTVKLIEFTNSCERIAEVEALTLKQLDEETMYVLRDHSPVVVMADAPNPEDRVVVSSLHAGAF